MRISVLLAVIPLAACDPGECYVEPGPYDCTLTIQSLNGQCNGSVGQKLSWVFTVANTPESERVCKTENVSSGPNYEAGQGVYIWYDSTLSAVASDRLEGVANYRISPNQSGTPDCRISGPLVCSHR